MKFLSVLGRAFTRNSDDLRSPYDAPEGRSDDSAALSVCGVFIPEFEADSAQAA